MTGVQTCALPIWPALMEAVNWQELVAPTARWSEAFTTALPEPEPPLRIVSKRFYQEWGDISTLPPRPKARLVGVTKATKIPLPVGPVGMMPAEPRIKLRGGGIADIDTALTGSLFGGLKSSRNGKKGRRQRGGFLL